MKEVLCLLLLISSLTLNAQAENDKVDDLNDRYFELYDSMTDYQYLNIDTAEFYANKLLSLSEKNADSLWMAAAYEGLGYVHFNREQMTRALPYFEKQRDILLHNASSAEVAVAYMNLGNVYGGMAQYDLGIQSYLRAASLLPEDREYDIDRAYLNYNLANTLMDFEDFENAPKYIDSALSFSVKEEVKDLYAPIINLSAELAIRKGDYEKAISLADSSLILAQESSDLVEEIYSLELKARGLSKTGKNEQAISLQNEGLRKALIYGDPYLEVLAHAQLAAIYLRAGNQKEAQKNAALAYKKRNNQSSLSVKKKAAEIYAKVLANAGEYKLQAQVLNQYIRYQDSLHRVNLNESILAAQNKTIAQNNELLRSSAELQKTIIDRNNLIRLILTIALVLAIIMLVIIGITNRKKNLANQELLTNQSLLDEKTKALEQVNAQLENLNQGKDKLLSILTHDIKQPFNQTLGVLELLDVYTEDNEELHKVLTQVRQSVENDKKTVENLLIWSKSQFARISAHPEEVDCNDVAFKVMNELKTSLQEKEIDLNVNIARESRLMADPYHIEIILRNLITNAVKFSHKGGKLELSTQRKNEKLEIAIRDEGVGMSENELARLFDQDRHFSQNGTLNEAGTGLGMMIVHDFVKENDGEIFVESEPDKGSVFRLLFPAV